MKKITYLIIAAAGMLTTFSSEAAVSNVLGKKYSHPGHQISQSAARISPADMRERIRRAEMVDATYYRFVPGSQTVYGWNGDDWEFDAYYTMQYDTDGHMTQEIIEDSEGYFSRTTFYYNSDGMLTSQLEEISEDGINYVNYSKTERFYDPIVKDLIIKNRQYYWNDGGWVATGNNYNRNVTRNDEGNVTQVEIAVLFDGVYDPMDRIDVAYGDDGKACSIKESELNYDGRDFFWEDDMAIVNIVWDRTDGQIVAIDSFGLGANRIKSADQISDDDENLHLEMEYSGDNFIASISGVTYGEQMQGTITYEQIDNYGSFCQISEFSYTSPEYGSYTETETYTETYDAFGYLLESRESVAYDDEEEIFEEMHGSMEYDSQLGCPLTYILSTSYYDYDLEEVVTENMLKAEFADYIGIVSQVADVEASNGIVEYFTLQGIKVTNPMPGAIYIRKQNGKTDKVIIR